MNNIEIKAFCPNPDYAEQTARKIGAVFKWQKRQTDIYWQTPSGRLKLRLQESDPAELIAYHRAMQREPWTSDYEIFRTDKPNELEKVLAKVLPRDITVEKLRTLFLWRNVRIHLDQVKGLGTFIEFEAVMGEGKGREEALADIELLMQWFEISDQTLIEKGYYELIKEQQGASQT